MEELAARQMDQHPKTGWGQSSFFTGPFEERERHASIVRSGMPKGRLGREFPLVRVCGRQGKLIWTFLWRNSFPCLNLKSSNFALTFSSE